MDMDVLQSDLLKFSTELSKFTNDQLKEWCNTSEDDKFNEFVNNSDRVKELEQERQVLMASVRSLAEFNLGRQEEYELSRKKLKDIVEEANQMQSHIDGKSAKLLELSKKTSLETTLQTLLLATTQAEEKSESIAQIFLDNSIDHQQFYQEYIDQRKLAHLRRIKADRLQQEIGYKK